MEKVKIYKGYCIHESERLGSIFKTTDIYNSVEEFLEKEECFFDYLKEYFIDEEIEEEFESKIEKFKNNLNLDELEDFFIKYNECDDLKMYYDFENLDNRQQTLTDLAEILLDEALDSFEDISPDVFLAEEVYNAIKDVIEKKLKDY